MNDTKMPLIYEVEITIENIKELLYKEMCRVALEYGGSPQRTIAAMILPPSAFKIMEQLCRDECRFQDFRENHETISFNGIPLFCGATPIILSVYGPRGWSCAHMDSKKLVSQIGGLDS
jgi:hypothetical protein